MPKIKDQRPMVKGPGPKIKDQSFAGLGMEKHATLIDVMSEQTERVGTKGKVVLSQAFDEVREGKIRLEVKRERYHWNYSFAWFVSPSIAYSIALEK